MKKKHLVTREDAEEVERNAGTAVVARLAKSYLALMDVVEEQQATIAAMQ